VDLELPRESAEQTLRAALADLTPLCEHLALFGAYPLTTDLEISAQETTARESIDQELDSQG